MSIFWRCDMMRYHFISLRTVRPKERAFLIYFLLLSLFVCKSFSLLSSACNCVSVCQSLTLSFYLSSSLGPLVGSFNYAPKMNWTNIVVLECGWYSFNGRSHRSWRRRRRRRRRRPSADVGLRKTQNEEMFIITTRVWLLSNFLTRRFLRYFELTSCSLSHKILFFWAMGLAQLDIIRYEVLSIWFNCLNSMIS